MLRRVLFSSLSLFALPFAVISLAAPIDDQTPIPNASLRSEYNFSREYCLNDLRTEVSECSTVNVQYPSGLADYIDGFVRTAIIDRLKGGQAASSIERAMETFLAYVAPNEGLQQSNIVWRNLGRNNVLTELVESVSEFRGQEDRRFLRQFIILQQNTEQPLVLADVIIAGQGEALANLQRRALAAWFAGHGVSESDISLALPAWTSDNWAISQNELVFSYDPVQIGGQTLLPLIVLPVDALEGIIRPDILTAARSWPVDVVKELSSFENIR